MRIGLGFVVIITFGKTQFFRPTGAMTSPVGIARVVDLRWAGSRAGLRWIQFCAYAATLFYVADLLVPLALLILSAAIIVDVTFRSSYGAVNHGHALLAMVLTAQTAGIVVWHAAERWGWDLGEVLARSEDTTAAWWAVQAILAVYLTSGLSKLIKTRCRWIQRSPGLLLAAHARVETDRQMGDASWGASGKSVALVAWLSERSTITRCVFAAGLLIELTSPIGLWGETALMYVGLGLIALHLANGRLLGLPFVEYQLLVLTYLVNVPQLMR
jgi:hypothetical protein